MKLKMKVTKPGKDPGSQIKQSDRTHKNYELAVYINH